MGPVAVVAVAVGGIGTAVYIDDRNDRIREAQAERDRLARIAEEIEQRRIRDEAEKKKQLEEQIRKQEEERKRLEAYLKKEKELQRKRIEKSKLEKELQEKRIKEEKAEKERQKQELINEANKYYINEKEKYEKIKLKQILDNFKYSMKNNFCSNQANLLDNYIKYGINNIFKDLDRHIKKKVNEIYLSNLNNIKKEKDKKHRILLIGRTGVGKSTLINSIFDYDLAETGVGRPITMYEKPKKYEHYSREDLELFDTRGIELDPNFGIQKTSNMVEEFIKDQVKNKSPIKAIWYCVTGCKIEDVELNLIKKFCSLYKNNSLPVIIVYTQCVDDITFSQFKSYLETRMNNKIIIKKILAKMKNINGINCKSYGLEELLNETKEEIDKNDDVVNILTAKMKTEEYLESILNNQIIIDNNIQFNKKIEKIIFSFFQKFDKTFMNHNIIESFCTQYNNKCKSIIKNNLNEIVNKEAQRMKIDLSDILTKVIKKYGNIISINQNIYYNDYQIKINQVLSDIANSYGMNNFNSITEQKIIKGIKTYISSKVKFYISSI